MYCMGDEADDILKGLNLTDENMQQYYAVNEGFHTFFVAKKNVIYKRARFNMRKQRENESVDSFVTALFSLVEHCKYGPLHNELIRDRLVVGLNYLRLSERMQLDKDLISCNLRGECAFKTPGSMDRVISRTKAGRVKSAHGAKEKM